MGIHRYFIFKDCPKKERGDCIVSLIFSIYILYQKLQYTKCRVDAEQSDSLPTRQLLFDKSFEYGEYEGLGLIPGEIRPISDVISPDLKIPHIGWNALHFASNRSEIFKYLNELDCVYFVHSYYATGCDEYTTAKAEYSAYLTAAVQNRNVYGCQFHPEKSGEVGLKILRAFCELERVKC